jgi:hypothetical protein
MPGNLVATSIRTVPVREKELFYFRALLQDWPATSFRGLRTVDGLSLQTYQEVDIVLGLL